MCYHIWNIDCGIYRDDNIWVVKKLISDNRPITIEVADNVVKLFNSCQTIFKDILGIKRVAAKIVLKLLNFEQKQRSIDFVNDDLYLLKKVITT